MTSANSMSILKGCAIWRDARWIHALRNWDVYAAAVTVRLKALAPYGEAGCLRGRRPDMDVRAGPQRSRKARRRGRTAGPDREGRRRGGSVLAHQEKRPPGW